MIVLLQTYFCLLETYHDLHVIKGSDKSQTFHNSKWHKWDSFLWLSIYIWMAVEHNDPVYILTGLTIRLFMLQVLLNKLRGLPLTYLGSGKIDKFCSVFIGKRTTLVLKSALFLMCFLYEIMK